MTTYDNTNSGILKKNDKGDNDKRPDFKGSIDIGGVQYWLSGWKREGKPGSKLEGQTFISLKAEAQEAQAAAPKPPVVSPTFQDSDIDF